MRANGSGAQGCGPQGAESISLFCCSASSARLKYAYAEAMLDAGDVEQARTWFARAAAADVDGELDAHERLEQISGAS